MAGRFLSREDPESGAGDTRLTLYKRLYDAVGLYRIPTTAPWTQAAKASGRR
jgi:hypothetical protein